MTSDSPERLDMDSQLSPEPEPATSASSPEETSDPAPAAAPETGAEETTHSGSTSKPASKEPSASASDHDSGRPAESTTTSQPAGETSGAGLASRVRQQWAQRESAAKSTPPAPPPEETKRDDDDEADPVEEAMKRAAGGSKSADRVPVPSLREPLPEDLEKELEAALGGASLDQILAQEASSGRPAEQLELDTQRSAQVVRIHKDNVFFSLGGRNEGVASLRQFEQPPAVGDQLDVTVVGYSREDGLYELTIPGASISVADWSDISEGALVEARVTGANTGGLECLVGNIRGFIPASQVAVYRVENLSELIGEKLVCLITEANEQRGNLVLSRRSVIEREREEARQSLMASLEPGQTREGIVRSIRDFGAFVDLGGVDGLIHISQLSWDRVENPRDVLEEGQRVNVRIEKIDPETGKISLSYRNLQDHPWETAPAQFPAGSVVPGTVTRIAKFGAFVKLAPGVEGLIHISELAHQRIGQVSQVVKEGQQLEVKVLSMDPENQRIALSLKALLAAPSAEEPGQADPEEEESAPVARPKSNVPLKGGVDRPSGGDSFGLKW